MYLFLIIGVVVGALGVEFALLNTEAVTVTLFAWQFISPLSLVIFVSMLLGIGLAVLAMIPSAIREALDTYAVRRELRRAQNAQPTSAPADNQVIA